MAKVADSARQHPGASVLVGLGVLSFVIDLVKKFTTSSDAVDWLIHHGVKDEGAHLQSYLWFRLMLMGVLAAVIVLAAVCWVFFAELKKKNTQLSGAELAVQEKDKSALKTLHGMVDAAVLIQQHLIPAAQKPINSFTLMKTRYLIEKDFTATVESEYHMKASDHPIHFWELEFGLNLRPSL